MAASQVTTLFLDIGGVLLTNGWDKNARQRASDTFGLDYAEMDGRHHLTFDTYEEGQLDLDEYLSRVVFHRPRSFTREDFREFMFAQSQAFPEMIALVRRLKERWGLQTVAVSNEGRELTVYRIQKFELASCIDFFVSSCFVHRRKPDADMYTMALDMAQAQPSQVVYLDDRSLFVEVARSLGIRGVHHTSVLTTQAALKEFGLDIA